MMQMVNNESASRYFDCIWIIRPSDKYYHLKTHQSLQLAYFSVLPESSLIIRSGTNSIGDILGNFSEAHNGAPNDKYVLPLGTGFYVHLRGNFSRNSTFALVYTAFSYADCLRAADFQCANQLCIPMQVKCDGFNHCGDGSDEPMSCAYEWNGELVDRQWYKYVPNYYFPANEYDIKSASILFMGTSSGLIVLVACLFLILYRINVKARQQRELQQQLQTISELLGELVG